MSRGLLDGLTVGSTDIPGTSGVVQMTQVMPKAHCVAAAGSADVFEWGWVGGESGWIEVPPVMAAPSDVEVYEVKPHAHG